MKREKYIEDYEDFEPEMRTWPFLLLSFLIPVIPLIMNILLESGFSWLLVLEYIIVLMPLFCTALCIRDGERAWLLIVSSALYWLSVLLEWSLSKLDGRAGYPLGIPFILALTPGILPLEAYTFFSKRKRSNWIGWALVSFIFSLSSSFITWNETGNGILWIIYPSVMVFLSLMLFFVTRRTESTPWYVTIPLVLLSLSSFLLYPGFTAALISGTLDEKVHAALGCFLYSFTFWYTLSFLFVFSGLAGKSSYRKTMVDEEEENVSGTGNYDDMEERIVVPPPETQTNYTNPPLYSRFDSSSPRREEEREEKKQMEESSAVRRESRGTDDRWYDFLEGGVKSDEDTRSRDERRITERDYPLRRDDRSYYRATRDRYYRDERRERDRYDDRDRYYRDERRERDRYDDRDRYYRDERRESDRYDDGECDYRRESGRCYDDDYYRYGDRDRRD